MHPQGGDKFAKVDTDAQAKDEEIKDFSVRKGFYELPEMFIPYICTLLIARNCFY